MTWLRLALANLRVSPLTSSVNVLLFALGTASIVLLLLIGDQLSTTLSRDARGVDLVLGAKGSPTQLVLSSVYHADIPTGNIPKAEADRWAADARVAQAIPLSLGDSYRGFRIVGTTSDYVALYRGGLAAGRFWHASMEAVVGAVAAREANLGEGDRFAGAHGLVDSGHDHTGRAYKVVGVLAPTGTVLDRLILTSLDSVWALHALRAHEEHRYSESENENERQNERRDDERAAEHSHDADEHKHDEVAIQERAVEESREITALLLRYSTPLAATTLPRQINQESKLQAAAPAFEIARLLQLVGLGLDGLRAFAGLLILTAAFSVFAALYGALKARRYDLAMLRCLGATRAELMVGLLIEGLLLAIAGALVGFALGHAAVELLARWLAASRGVSATGWIWLPSETLLLLGLLVVGALAAALPAWEAYRTDVARTLAS